MSMIKPAYDLVESNLCGLSVENDPKIVAEAILQLSTMNNEKYCKNSRKIAEEYDYKKLVGVLIDKIEA